MNALQKWQAIQRKVGSEADGIPGERTADRVMAALGIAALPADPASGLVKGTGKGIRRIFIHCTATREGQDIDAATIKRWHLAKGWKDIGYHFVIRLNGTIERGRDEAIPGSHVQGFNTGSIGVVYVGGLDPQGRAKDTRTAAQKQALAQLVAELVRAYPGAEVMGHRDASPDKDGDGQIEPNEWLKDCPCFDVRAWWKGVQHDGA